MLVEFTVKNYRSFRDEAVLSMEATGLSTLKSVLIPYGGLRILPSVAIYGKNGGGKSNVIRAFLAFGAVYKERAEDATRKCSDTGCSVRVERLFGI